MSNVNITILRPAGYVFSSAFIDIVKYLQFYIGRLRHNVVITENCLIGAAYNIVFGAHLLTDPQQNFPRRTIIFNTEPMPLDQGYWRRDSVEIYKDLIRRYPIWDYSGHHEIASKHLPSCTIPLLYCPAFRRRTVFQEPRRGLLFYGEITGRRQRIIGDLTRRGVEVRIVTGDFCTVRNLAISQSLAVLNLHKHQSMAVLETVRCFYPLNLGIPVITEGYVVDPNIGSYHDFVFEIADEHFAAATCELLGSHEDFDACSSAMIARFRRSDPTDKIAAAVEVSFRF